MPQRELVTIYVSYVGPPTARFDRSYYVTRHLPLVMDVWGPLGLLKATAFFPEAEAEERQDHPTATLVICECVFRDEAAVDAAFASTATPQVVADVSAFTDLDPQRTRSLPMK